MCVCVCVYMQACTCNNLRSATLCMHVRVCLCAFFAHIVRRVCVSACAFIQSPRNSRRVNMCAAGVHANLHERVQLSIMSFLRALYASHIHVHISIERTCKKNRPNGTKRNYDTCEQCKMRHSMYLKHAHRERIPLYVIPVYAHV